jgi:hypothetical protein
MNAAQTMTGPLSDSRVDNIADQQGVIDTLPSLAFDIPDDILVKNLDARIADSKGYFNDPKGFNLEHARNEAMRMYLGKQSDPTQLYRYQTPYIENQLYVAVESIVAYLTAQNPQPEVYPAQDTPQSKLMAADLEKAMMAHSEHFQLAGLIEQCVRQCILKRIGIIYFHYDPDYGRNGEIVPLVISSEHYFVDKNAKKDGNPELEGIYIKMSASEILHRWPNKKKQLFETMGWKNMSDKRMQEELVVRLAWVTYYDKQFKPIQGCVWYIGDVVLEKTKDYNWLHASPDKNFIPQPKKPFIHLNFDNDGEHIIDYTSPIDQAKPMQETLNKRGLQATTLIDKANGVLVVSSDSGLTKDDLQNLTGDPNQRLLIKTANMKTSDMVFQVPPPEVSDSIFQDKQDLREQLHSIMGTPSEFTGGSDGDDTDQTLGQSIMKKDQASGRQDLFARAIDRFMSQYFNFLTQMMVVWYDEKHYFVYNGGDGEFDYITMSRDLIDKGIAVNVKSGTTLPFDKTRQEAVGLQLAKMDKIAPLDLYKMLHIPNPQSVYDNWVKYQTQPEELARDANEQMDSSAAYVAFIEIMAGRPAQDPDDCTKEFVLSLRKLMLRDEFLKAKKKRQLDFLAYVEKALTSLELRTSLDVMSQQGDQMLDPNIPIQPYQPPQPQMPMMPGAAPGMSATPPQGGVPGASPSMIPTQGQPSMGMPQGMPLPAPSPMNGTPLQNPANPQLPQAGNPSAIPVV